MFGKSFFFKWAICDSKLLKSLEGKCDGINFLNDMIVTPSIIFKSFLSIFLTVRVYVFKGFPKNRPMHSIGMGGILADSGLMGSFVKNVVVV